MLNPSIFTRLTTQLEILPLVLGGATPDALQKRPPSDKWSAHENLAHLARHHEVFLERLHRILKEESPRRVFIGSGLVGVEMAGRIVPDLLWSSDPIT